MGIISALFAKAPPVPVFEDSVVVREEVEYRGFVIVHGDDGRWYHQSSLIDPGGLGYETQAGATKAIDLFWPHVNSPQVTRPRGKPHG